jgi:hypothetical protein
MMALHLSSLRLREDNGIALGLFTKSLMNGPTGIRMAKAIIIKTAIPLPSAPPKIRRRINTAPQTASLPYSVKIIIS